MTMCFRFFRDKCGRCHVEGGVAPMSLMTYDAAFPWAESIRVELIASHMPPANAMRGFGALKHASLLTATELDTVLTWATGGNPRGSVDRAPSEGRTEQHLGARGSGSDPTAAGSDARGGQDGTGPGVHGRDGHNRGALASGGRPAARFSLHRTERDHRHQGHTGPAAGAEPVLRRWLPGQDVESIDRDGAAFKLPANAVLTVQIHYKKTWQAEGQSPKDKSTIGLYFAPNHGRSGLARRSH